MRPPTLVLLPSPLLGAAVWAPGAAELRRRGWPVTVAPGAAAPRTPGDVLEALAASVPRDRDVVLVPHSNAGWYVPGLAQRRAVVAHVLVDAVLPPARGRVALAPPALAEHLRALADDEGTLPPWTGWWPQADVSPLFPDDETRRRVEAEQPRLPMAYFDAVVDVAAGWDDVPGAYLAFGDTYADEASRAGARGWPVRRLDGAHLHMLVAPGQVAAAVTGLLAAVGVRPAPTA